ncbi:hypothetical protein SD960_09560 [Flavobacterium sp. MMLR14_040]|jgi:hypothetical protein|uniref:Uncharacterized protein n=1 Tax=Flavobacterium pectinovorum TaxID=29533 RepID=A0AB36P3P2_9FLAO|nr:MULTISPECIES: hypothetical protein [Flavobacterium]KIQ18054.1 hypothetical protein RT99_18550 [Flavobacterium sp. MEB061]MDW8850337.1 hypothetical protein [Flavobacterium sp. MMLR14_040]OXB05957.1 hypothetical protein B0A72_08085 [Flavobacterium pectinovorum]SHM18386.1 hypothetical protein SAMN05444387_2134 [Flavobacterium pectinovorum]
MTLYQTTFENFNKNYMGSAAMAVIGQSCLGGAAAMYILSHGTSIVQMIQLAIIVLASVFANTSILAQMKHKVVFNLIILSALLSVFFIFLNSFVL